MLTLDAFIYIHLSNMNIHVVQQQKDQTVQNKTNKQKKALYLQEICTPYM